jgi:hypothetical protein
MKVIKRVVGWGSGELGLIAQHHLPVISTFSVLFMHLLIPHDR